MLNESAKVMIEAKDLSKYYGEFVAVRRLSFAIPQGQIVAFLGPNGAGKTTTMKLLTGYLAPTAGSAAIAGCDVRRDRIGATEHLGYLPENGPLYSEMTPLELLTFFGEAREIDAERLQGRITAVRELCALQEVLDKPINKLSRGLRQRVGLAQALLHDPDVLIMDEPTSSLSHKETEQLFNVVNELKSKGVSIVYISHRLSEVKRLADRVAVLRDGCNAGELAGDDITYDNMVRLMVGRDVSQYYQHTPLSPGGPVLEVEDLVVEANPHRKLSFKIHSGEVVGMAGLVGAGRTEVLQTLFGVTPALSGSITVDGQPLESHSPADAIRRGMALAPEDRKRQGLIMGMSVRQNTSLASLYYDQRKGLLNHPREKLVAGQMMQRMQIKAVSYTHLTLPTILLV